MTDDERFIGKLNEQCRQRNQQYDGHMYVASVLLGDITEERIRLGEILAPDWFMRAYMEGFRVVERIAEQSK